MSNKALCILAVFSMIAIPGYSAKEHVVRFQNHVRIGYDDNVYLNDDKHGSAFITDIVNLSGKLNFSTRTDALLYWQPEVRYYFDKDPDTDTYHDFYGRLNHALSQRAFLTISDRIRYQIRDAQSGSGVNSYDQNYFQNELLGSIDYTLNAVSSVKLGGGYLMRIWDDKDYGEGLGNDFDQYTADASLFRELQKDVSKGMVGVNYAGVEYDGSRGGYDAVSVMGGLDQNFSPDVTGFARVGYTFVTVENLNGNSDNSLPYAELGLDFNPSDRTSINGVLAYSISRSENSVYNAQDQFKIGVGVRHDITAKVNLASTISYTFSQYDSDYSYTAVTVPDVDDQFFRFSLRGSYQLNRNNFIEAGYDFSDRSSDPDAFTEYDRNRVDVGWRLRL